MTMAVTSVAARMPAEWERHERCLMGWPTRAELWRHHLDDAKRDYAAIARAIADYEPVWMLALPANADEARRVCGSDVEVVEIELDDSWLRDTGPLFVRLPDGELAGVDFEFNGWGGKYRPFDADARLAAAVLERLDLPRRPGGCVLEGGAITVDGEGTLITTESVLRHPARNPGMSRHELELILGPALGVERVIWLADGLAEDRDTDGHVDNVCHFIAPGRVLVQTAPDVDAPNHAILEANREVLHAARDARGRALEVLELPHLPYLPDAEPPIVVPYLNFYLANDAVIVPVTGAADDARALELIGRALPDRAVVSVPGTILARGGGGVHCITQQQPAVAP